MEDNDHRIIGRKLGLYHIREDAPGMVFWHPEGWALYRQLEDYIRARMMRAGYGEVRSPQLLPVSLWERSGHWEKFGENMFAMAGHGEAPMALKPMSCPCHIDIFNRGAHSYRDLPVRYAEFGQCHRDEPSGAMHGLLRTRGFEQDDAHVLCQPDQVQGEVANFVRLLDEVYRDLGFDDYRVALSLRPAKRAGSDEDWDRAERDLLFAARAAGLDPELLPGEGAFYGPKLEFALKDRQGRLWQCGTIQLDMVLPGRLGAAFVNRHGEKEVPVMLHHAILGSMGRFIGILLEHCEGKLPVWLAPVQIAVLPVTDEQHAVAKEAHARLLAAGVRVKLFDRSEPLNARLRDVHEASIPLQVIIGARDAAKGMATLQSGSQRKLLSIPEIADLLRDHPRNIHRQD